uniref:VOC domain-containing protein n=1 Tax=Athene cunicularia TaxID=194338 RepID=A0A663M7Y5_ATHCN
MAALLSRPCFISLHMPYRQGWAQDLANTFRFQPVAVRETPRVRQLALRRGSAVFLVNQRLAPGPASTSSHDFLYDVDPRPALGTASNVCFEVDDVPGLCKRLQSQGCSLPVPPTEVRDDDGSVTYGVASSIVGNVSHTLLDRSRYWGPFLPGFQPIQGAPSLPVLSSPTLGQDAAVEISAGVSGMARVGRDQRSAPGQPRANSVWEQAAQGQVQWGSEYPPGWRVLSPPPRVPSDLLTSREKLSALI